MGAEISNFYMIGDNPAGDIYGANLMHVNKQSHRPDWSSILVQTGVYHPDSYGHHSLQLEGLHRPSYEVRDMYDALVKICQKEGLAVSF